MSKYFNNVVLGNGNILGCLTDKAELIRLYYPNIDYFQNIDSYKIGLSINNKTYFINDGELKRQYYEGNIINTELNVNGIDVVERDYILPDRNVLIRKIKISGNSNLLIYSKLNSDINKLVSSMIVDNSLIQYCQDMYMSTFSDKEISNYQINNSRNVLDNANLNSIDYIGMSSDSVILYTDISEITIYIALENNLKGMLKDIEYLKKQNEEQLYEHTKLYWKEYVSKYMKNILSDKTGNERENKITERSILLFAILSDQNTGGIIASPDVDEHFSRCGRYGYCWPRDALFINKALSILGMEDILDKFYTKWATKAQFDTGLFEQRYYANGELAPAWGIQIDETSSILIGVNENVKSRQLEELIVKAVVRNHFIYR